MNKLLMHTYHLLFWAGFWSLAWNVFMPEDLVWMDFSLGSVLAMLAILAFLAFGTLAHKERKGEKT